MTASFTRGFNAGVLAAIITGLLYTGCPGPSGDKVPVATGFDIQTSDYVDAGLDFTVTVRAIDSGGKTIPTYSGTIEFSSTDPQAILPASYTFTQDDNGVHIFSAGATLFSAGQRSIQVSDGNISGTRSLTVNPGLANRFTMALTTTLTTTGEPITVGVTVWDGYGNIAENYKGPVYFTSSDFQAQVPGTYYFTANDAGVHYFPVYINSPGPHSVCVHDDFLNIQACKQVTVYMFIVPHYYINADSASTGFSIPVTLTDPSTGNPVITGTVTAIVSTTSASVFTVTSLGNGNWEVALTITKATSFLLTVTCSGCSGTPSVVSIITVTPGAVVPGNCFVSNPSISVAPVVNVATGVDISPTVTVTLRDSFMNTVPFQKSFITGLFITDFAGIGLYPTESVFCRLRKVRDHTNGSYTLWISNGWLPDGTAPFSSPQDGNSELTTNSSGGVDVFVQYNGISMTTIPKSINFVSVGVFQRSVYYIPTSVSGFTAGTLVLKDGMGFSPATVSYSFTKVDKDDPTPSATASSSVTTTQAGGVVTEVTLYDPVSERAKLIVRESSTGAADAIEFRVVTFSLITTTTSVPVTGTATFFLRAYIRDPSPGHKITAMTTSSNTSVANSATPDQLTDAGKGWYILNLNNSVAESNIGVTFTFEDSVVTTSTSINFVAGIAITDVSPQSTLFTPPNWMGTTPADGASSVAVTAQLQGVAPACGTVTISSTGSPVVTPVVTNADGSCTAYVTDSNPETVTITATDTGSGSFAKAKAEFVRVNLSVAPSTSPATGPITVPVTATIVGGTPASGRTLNVVPASATASIGAINDMGGGIYRFDVADTLAESFTIAVYDTTSGAENSIGVTFTTIGTAGINLAPSAWSVPIGSTINLSSTLTGFVFSGLTGRAVTFTTSSPSVIFVADITGGGGVSNTTIMSSMPQIVSVTAADPESGASATITVEFVGITIEPGTTSLKIGTSTILTVKAGPGGGRLISLSSAGSSQLMPSPDTSCGVGLGCYRTDSTGTLRVSVTDAAPETVTFTFLDVNSGATASTTIDFYQ